MVDEVVVSTGNGVMGVCWVVDGFGGIVVSVAGDAVEHAAAARMRMTMTMNTGYLSMCRCSKTRIRKLFATFAISSEPLQESDTSWVTSC